MEVLKIYNALLRRKWLVLESVLFFLLAAVALFFLLPKEYQATSKLIVESSDTTNSVLSDLGLEEVALSLSSGSDDIQNKIALATLRPVLEEVIWKLQLRDDAGVLLKPDKLVKGGFLDELLVKPSISVTQAQGTDILLVQASSQDPELSRLMADTLARAYIRQSEEREREDARQARKFVAEQLKNVQADLDEALAAIAEAQKDEQVLDMDAEVKAAVSRVSELMLDLEASAASIQALRAQIAEAERFAAQETPDFVGPTSLSENAQVRDLRALITELKQKREAELLEKTEKHPDVLLLDREIETAQAQLQQALEAQHALSPDLADLRGKLVAEREKAKETRDAIQRLMEQFSSYPEKMRRLTQLQLAADASEKLYQSLQEQVYEIAIAEALTVSDLQLVEPAVEPDRPARPKLLVNAAGGLFLGIVFALGLVFLVEYLDDTIKTPDELREAWDLPQMGVIPHFGKREDVRLIVDLPAHDPVAEAYRTVRNSIAYATLDKPPRYLALTSSIPGEGKSTVSLNLAISLARDGKRVVVVDADFRRPSQHRFWPQTNNHKGVTNVLLGEMELEEAIQDLPVPNLRLLAAGPVPSDPGRLVESLKMRQVLMDVARTCDIVILDTPPIMVVNDAVVLGRQVDQILVVVEAGKASRRIISDLKNRMESAGLEPLGLILNKLDTSSSYGGYYRYYRDHYAPRTGSRSSGRKRSPSRSRSRKARKGGAA